MVFISAYPFPMATCRENLIRTYTVPLGSSGQRSKFSCHVAVRTQSLGRPSQVLSLAKHVLGYLVRSSLIHIPRANAITALRLRRCSVIRNAPASRAYLFSLIRVRCSRTRASCPRRIPILWIFPTQDGLCKFSRALEFTLRRCQCYSTHRLCHQWETTSDALTMFPSPASTHIQCCVHSCQRSHTYTDARTATSRSVTPLGAEHVAEGDRCSDDPCCFTHFSRSRRTSPATTHSC
ncbi:hypothetical protein EDD22DRAFT_352907 [Suillus occidentalis]|nr:hypothetical protein EDD22DRAFT_352907 [Suillus occidentalis]